MTSHTLVVIPTHPELKKIGRQMEDLYRKAQLGLLNAIAVGDLVAQARQVVSTVETTSHKATRGPQTKGDGIKGILAEIAPSVPLSTAYRFEQLAENVRAEFAIGVRTPLAQIITGEKKDDKSLKLLAKLSDFVVGKTQRALLLEIGTPDPEIGGKRTKTKKLTPEQERAEWIAAATQTAKTTANAIQTLDDRWKLLDDVELKLAIAAAKKFTEEAAAWLATPQPSRAALQVEKYLQQEEAKS